MKAGELFLLAEPAGCLNAVRAGHVHVHQHQVVGLLRQCCKSFFACCGQDYPMAAFFEQASRYLLVDGIVLCQKNVQAFHGAAFIAQTGRGGHGCGQWLLFGL